MEGFVPNDSKKLRSMASVFSPQFDWHEVNDADVDLDTRHTNHKLLLSTDLLMRSQQEYLSFSLKLAKALCFNLLRANTLLH